MERMSPPHLAPLPWGGGEAGGYLLAFRLKGLFQKGF